MTSTKSGNVEIERRRAETVEISCTVTIKNKSYTEKALFSFDELDHIVKAWEEMKAKLIT